ncbi:unnamed protein product [Ambrosiozyma monospora]|uniref:Unnamed protein product n=1 Tax=Ambrosiozyma monospora TaxID=43982 RepID=A0ACB5TB70_AMBMO|nr:unnamed protein product [Ambrosiozyma monospora]
MFALKRGLLPSSKNVVFKSTLKPKRKYATVKTLNIDWDPIKTKKQLIKGKEVGNQSARNIVFGLMCLTPIITFGLGCWQVQRLKWKNKLIASCEDRLTYKATPLPKSVTREQIPDLEYRKVLITGHFDYSREIFVGPRLHEGQKGYLLVCPFVQSNGAGEILVDRGWIADEKIIPERRNLQHLSCPQGEITIECMLKVPPKKDLFMLE